MSQTDDEVRYEIEQRRHREVLQRLDRIAEARDGDEKCSACRYWIQSAESACWGWCRRFPPSISADGEPGESEFPTVTDEGWCGEWRRA